MPKHPVVHVPDIGPMDHAWDLLGEWRTELDLPNGEDTVHGCSCGTGGRYGAHVQREGGLIRLLDRQIGNRIRCLREITNFGITRHAYHSQPAAPQVYAPADRLSVGQKAPHKGLVHDHDW